MTTSLQSAALPGLQSQEPSLDEQRERIDDIDRQLVGLLAQRAEAAAQIGRIKAASGQEVLSLEREEQVLRRTQEMAQGSLGGQAVRNIFREIISACRNLQYTAPVAYLGPEFSFSHGAAAEQFGQSCALAPQKSIARVFEAVAEGECSAGVVPVENSSEGDVIATAHAFTKSGLMARGEIYLPVRLALMSQSGDPGRVRRVYSHPHALAQARDWLAENLSRAALRDAASTAAAAGRAAQDPEAAAVGSLDLARAMGLTVIAQNIQRTRHNTTRFLVIAPKDCRPTGRDKTSLILFAGDRPGLLHRALQAFAAQGLNLTRIQSFQNPSEAGRYVFFLDFQAHRTDQAAVAALSRLAEDGCRHRVLGSYPESLSGHPNPPQEREQTRAVSHE